MSKQIKIKDQTLILDQDKALFWKEMSMLILSDLHFGKAEHLNKNGIMIPGNVIENDLKRLGLLIDKYTPLKLLIVGDLFHATYNPEWELFKSWRNKNRLEIILVKGNHDILNDDLYLNLDMQIVTEKILFKPFTFIHIPINKKILNEEEGSIYYISGHVHPGLRLSGKAQQSMSLPCFYFDETQAILPSFGSLTGLYLINDIINSENNAKIFAIANSKILLIN